MALTDTPWSGGLYDSFYLQSGTFTSTLKHSLDPLLTSIRTMDWDGVDTFTYAATGTRLFKMSGQFTTTVRDSYGVAGDAGSGNGVSPDVTNSSWSSDQANKLFLQSSKFTSTIKDSENVSGSDQNLRDISFDGINTPWSGTELNKLFLTSGQFTNVIKISISTPEVSTFGISWTGTDTLDSGWTSDTLRLTSGQFTSTVKDSEYVNGIDGNLYGISTNDFDARIDSSPPAIIINVNDTITITEDVPLHTVMNIAVNDSITADDSNIMITIPVIIIVNDTIAITEDVTKLVKNYISVNDSIAVAEDISINVSFSELIINVSDSITANEYVKAVAVVRGDLTKKADVTITQVKSSEGTITRFDR